MKNAVARLRQWRLAGTVLLALLLFMGTVTHWFWRHAIEKDLARFTQLSAVTISLLLLVIFVLEVRSRIIAGKSLQGIFSDMSERVRMEQSLAEEKQRLATTLCSIGEEKRKMENELLRATKLESVALLAGEVAHDFNNILTVILGNLTLAKAQLHPMETVFHRIDEAERAALRARNLTQQLLTFAQDGTPICETSLLTEIIMKKPNGLITVQSQPDTDTRFDLYLPALRNAAPAAPLTPPAVPPAPAPQKARILVMDDEPAICELVEAMLAAIGFEVEAVEDGFKAIERYRAAKIAGQPFDLVIMDLTIPGGMGGKETIQRLKEFDPNARAIVSSGYFNDPVMANFREHGFSGVVAKPYQFAHMIKAIREVIAQDAPAEIAV